MTTNVTSSLSKKDLAPEKKQWKRFIFRAGLLFFLFLLLNFGLVSLFEYHIMSQDLYMWRWKHQVAENKNQAGKKDYQVLWLGDSRVLGAIDPNFLAPKTKKSMVNLASGGMQFPAMFFLLKRYLAHHKKPEAIFLSQAPYAWQSHAEYLEHQLKFAATPQEFIQLAPHLKEHWNLLLLYPLYCLKSVYVFNPEFRGSLFKRSNHNHLVEKQMQQNLGFRSWTTRELQPTDSLELDWKFDPAPLNLLYFEKILQLCKKNHIPVLFHTMPFPKSRLSALKAQQSTLLSDYVKYLEKMEKKHSFHWIQKIDALPDNYFADFSHLNEQGAKKYMQQLVTQISQWLP